MIVVAFAEAVLIAGLLLLIHSLSKSAMLERKERAEAYEQSLQRMADRVQQPERLPALVPADFVIPEPEPDEFDLVGTIADPPRDES